MDINMCCKLEGCLFQCKRWFVAIPALKRQELAEHAGSDENSSIPAASTEVRVGDMRRLQDYFLSFCSSAQKGCRLQWPRRTQPQLHPPGCDLQDTIGLWCDTAPPSKGQSTMLRSCFSGPCCREGIQLPWGQGQAALTSSPAALAGWEAPLGQWGCHFLLPANSLLALGLVCTRKGNA